MAQRLGAILRGDRPPGVYRWLSRSHPGAVRRELGAAGWVCGCLSGPYADRSALLEACASVLHFPTWYGRNWDALALCLSDLSWLPAKGYLLLWERHAALLRADPSAWEQALGVFATAIAARVGVPPLYVLLRGSPCDLPRL